MSGGWNDAHYVEESATPLREDRYTLQNVVGPHFFRTLGIQMLAGRDFSAVDRNGGPAVCVLNRSAAAYFFPGRVAIGRQIARRQSGTQPAIRCEVIGVVEDAKYWTLNQEAPRTVYRPFAQEPPGAVAMVVKGSNIEWMATALRATFADVLPDAMIVTPVSLAEQTLASVSTQRVLAWISASLGLLALLLTCISLYGQVAWNVTQRTTEFGIRLALGGTTQGIVRLVLRDLCPPFTLGALAGCGVVAVVSPFVAALLYRTDVVDPALLATAVFALGLACAAAAYFPARRAAGVEPAAALRAE